MSSLIALVLLVAGLAFNLLGCIGLIRLPDVYNRLQAATKCVTLGTCLVLLAVIVAACGSDGAMAAKAALCVAFVLITSPTAAHALARGAHASRVKLWDKSVVDRYAEDHEPGVESEETP
jgi:multicomponent Na+:H+ antiporter subunit G